MDVVSYARPGPARRDRLSLAEVELISRTVQRAPEVMVKVLTHGGKDLKSVQRHLAYLNRKGELVHKILFSMPAGTPPKKVLEAVKDFAREEFALKHRYAMVLHTDEPHPHVHMVVKAVSEQGVRLNIRKALFGVGGRNSRGICALTGWRRMPPKERCAAIVCPRNLMVFIVRSSGVSPTIPAHARKWWPENYSRAISESSRARPDFLRRERR